MKKRGKLGSVLAFQHVRESVGKIPSLPHFVGSEASAEIDEAQSLGA